MARFPQIGAFPPGVRMERDLAAHAPQPVVKMLPLTRDSPKSRARRPGKCMARFLQIGEAFRWACAWSDALRPAPLSRVAKRPARRSRSSKRCRGIAVRRREPETTSRMVRFALPAWWLAETSERFSHRYKERNLAACAPLPRCQAPGASRRLSTGRLSGASWKVRSPLAICQRVKTPGKASRRSAGKLVPACAQTCGPVHLIRSGASKRRRNIAAALAPGNENELSALDIRTTRFPSSAVAFFAPCRRCASLRCWFSARQPHVDPLAGQTRMLRPVACALNRTQQNAWLRIKTASVKAPGAYVEISCRANPDARPVACALNRTQQNAWLRIKTASVKVPGAYVETFCRANPDAPPGRLYPEPHATKRLA